jgi:hypothetical protein
MYLQKHVKRKTIHFPKSYCEKRLHGLQRRSPGRTIEPGVAGIRNHDTRQ